MLLLNGHDAGRNISNFVFPLIENIDFREGIASSELSNNESSLIKDFLAGDLMVSYTYGWGSDRLIDSTDLDTYNISRCSLKELAKINSLNAIGKLKIRQDGEIYQLSASNSMAICAFLFSELWEQIEKKLGGKIIAAFPHPDVVLYVREDIPSAVSFLERAIEKNCHSETRRISRKIYRWVNFEWLPLIS